MPAFCVTGIAHGGGTLASQTTSCTSIIGLPAVIGVPLMVMAPVGGWMVVARREAR